MTHTETYTLALCPKCGFQMRLIGDYFEEEQTCRGCTTRWRLYSDRPGKDTRWEDQDSVFIAPDDPNLIPPHDGPFKRGN